MAESVIEFSGSCKNTFIHASVHTREISLVEFQVNVLFTLNRTTHSSILLRCVVGFNVNKTLTFQCGHKNISINIF